MNLVCPMCGKNFFWEIKYIVMISESLKRNPKVKIICGKCGIEKYLKYMHDMEIECKIAFWIDEKTLKEIEFFNIKNI